MTEDVFPVSSGQQRMWFLGEFEPEVGVHNIGMHLPMPCEVDHDRLVRALRTLAGRHEILRTRFAFQEGEVVQVIAPSVEVTVVQTDLTGVPPERRQAELDRIAREDAVRPFALDRAPVWRARLVRMDADDRRLIVIFDHTVFDGGSSDNFLGELWECFRAFDEGREPRLPELAIQYADYAVWQRERLTGEFLDERLRYWRRQLAGLPDDLGLPTDRPRPPVRSYRGAVHDFTLPAELTERVEALSRRLGVTPFTTLLTAYKAVLARWAGHQDIAVGCPVATRALPELEPLIGMFVNTVIVRTGLAGDPSFRDAVRRVRGTMLDAFEHADLPFELLVDALKPARDLARPPLFNVAFNLLPASNEGQIHNGTSKVDLSLDLCRRSGGLFGRLEYATDIFDAATARRLASAYETALTAIAADPDLPLSRVPLLREAERRQILTGWNRTEAAVPEATLPDLFEAQVVRTPDAPAVVMAGVELSYRELNARANRLAHELIGLGAGPETMVRVRAERSPELVVAVLAVLKAGAVYVPLDPEDPRHPDEVSGPTLTRQRVAEARSGATTDPPRRIGPGNAAYVIHTSGSTGRPKGCVNTHGAIVNRLDWMRRAYPIGTGDVVLHKTPIGFDVSVWELCWPLLNGAALALARPGGHRDPAYIRDAIVEHGVTVAHFVPSMLAAFLAEEHIEKCASLRRVLCSGEELPRAAADRFFERLPDTELHNLYGPAEAAIDVSAWRCQPGEAGVIPIGTPVANTRLHVLDRRLEPVPVGVTGDLYIGGPQLARGYAGLPGRTAQSFVADPHGPPGSRLYRTGDLARYRTDGSLEFRGRADRQVKVHGWRIEPGEIEAALAEHPVVARAVVALRADAPGGRGLVAYVRWTGDRDAAAAELRGLLDRRLPRAMMPQAFVLVDDFPSLPSGKVDVPALPSPSGDDAAVSATPYVEPRTPLEAELATIWSELLGRERVGAEHGFFELGGHSLLAVQLMNRIRAEFGVDIPVRRCFELSTVGDYALAVLEGQLAGHDAEALLAAVEESADE
ncbi:non-ribosomal peptide synthetase [Spirillospora sp. CA-294931]|uniref:non-ribosomal peptide synthetase n=1 Tax=Spirillospora sp. CA-294931 TaxID=3240042 RepID=UPI003D8C972E